MPDEIAGSGEGNTGGDGAGGKSGGTAVADKNEKKFFDEDYVNDLRQENGKHRLKAKELSDKLKAIEEAAEAAEAKKLEEEKEFKKLAEAAEKRAEKAAREAAATVEAQRRKTIRTEARARLIEAEILDPDDVGLLDLSKVVWDDDSDEPSGIREIVEAFKKAKPAKFKTADTTTTTTRAKTTTPSGNGMNRQEKIDYRERPTAEVNKAWDAKYVKA